MTEFRLNVIIDPKGADKGVRKVERGLTNLEQRANKVQIALRRAFAFFSLKFAITEIIRYADSFTDLQNRLRLLVPEQKALTTVTRDLLGIANRTRTALEGTVILYQRLGLATRELGIEQGDLLGVVESINQALILSGASAKEANNGLIQLSQGISSNRLGGDELRSTLEQLPAVADVIAKQMGVTRGELRAMGETGKITGEVIIEAFRNAREELSDKFARTVPTLSQSITVLKNNFIVFFGELNSGTGVLRVLGDTIRFVGNNIDVLVRSTLVLGAAFIGLRLAPTIQAFFQLQSALKAGTAVLLGSAEAARQKANFDRDQAAAALQAAAAEVAKTDTIVAGLEATAAQSAASLKAIKIEKTRASIQLEGARANVAAAQSAVANAQAERASVSLSGTLADLRTRIALAEGDVAVTRRSALLATEQLTAAEANLALTSGVVADTALLGSVDEQLLAKAHLAAAKAADTQAAAEARLAGATATANTQANIFTRTLSSVRGKAVGFFRLLAGNPVAVLVVGLVAAAAALIIFRDKIKLTEDGVGTLGDLFNEFFSQLGVALSVVAGFFRDAFGGAFKEVVDFISDFSFEFRDILLIPAAILDSLIGIFAGTFAAIISIFIDLPNALGQLFVTSANAAIDAIEFLPDVFVGIVKTIGQILSIFISGQLSALTLLGQSANQALVGNFDEAAQLAKDAAETSANAFDRATTGIGDRMVNNIADELDNELIPRIDNIFEGSFDTLGQNAAEAFSQGFNADVVGKFVQGLLTGGEDKGREREAADRAKEEAEARVKVASALTKQGEEFGRVLSGLKNEQELLELSLGLNGQMIQSNQDVIKSFEGFGVTDLDAQIEALSQVLAINQQLRDAGLPELSGDQQGQLAFLIQRNKELEEFKTLAEELQDPLDKIREREDLVTGAFVNGIISLQQYREEMNKLRVDAAEAGTSIADGVTTGLDKVKERLLDLASTMDNLIVNGFEGMVDALGNTFQAAGSFIGKLVEGGKASFADLREATKSFFKSAIDGILKELARLLAQKALLALLGFGTEGAGPGNFLGNLIFGERAAGGNTQANKPFLVGEQGPEIFTPGQTGSITPTDQTISSLTNASAAQGGSTVIQAQAPEVNVSVVNVTDPDEALSALDSPEGTRMILNILQKNPEAVRRI